MESSKRAEFVAEHRRRSASACLGGNEEYAEKFELYSGVAYPPKNAWEWTIALSKARKTDDYIARTLNSFGFEGYESAGYLPDAVLVGSGWPFSVEVTGLGWPTFSMCLLEDLQKHNSPPRRTLDAPAVKNTGGRNAGCVKLSRAEEECIKQYGMGKKPSELDSMMVSRGAARETGEAWEPGTAEKVIRAFKRREKNANRENVTKPVS